MEKLNVAGVTLQGYAQGGWQTSIYCPEVRAVFDTGCMLPGVNVDRLFITHSHPDHIGALPALVARRCITSSRKVLQIHVPEEIAQGLETALTEMDKLFGDRSDARDSFRIHGHKPGDHIPLNKEFAVRALETWHRGPSIGWAVEQTTRKLKPEFKGLEGAEIGKLRQKGVEITDNRVSTMLCIPGDTTIEFLLNQEQARKAKVLVHEVTVWDEGMNHVMGCREFGHTHVNEIIEHFDKFEGEALVLCHRSMRYSRRDIEEIAQERFSPAMLEKVHLFDGGDFK